MVGIIDMGVVDFIDEIVEISKEYNIWCYVDVVYGGFFLLVECMKERLKGISKVDFIVMDFYKGLFFFFGIGVVLIKDG